MAEKTLNYKLIKPLQSEFYDVDVQNGNMDIIDQALAELQMVIHSAVVKRSLTIPSDGWMTDPEEAPGGGMYIDIPQEDVTEEMVPIISILPEYADAAKAAGLNPSCRTLNGKIRLYAELTPKTDIETVLTLLQASGGASGGGSYTLPIATATRLGGVKIGENVNVTEDGTISVKGLPNDAFASESDIEDMLNSIFEPSGEDG